MKDNFPLFEIEDENINISDDIKKELLAELDTIRCTSDIIELYIGNFINTIINSFE